MELTKEQVEQRVQMASEQITKARKNILENSNVILRNEGVIVHCQELLEDLAKQPQPAKETDVISVDPL